MALAPILLSMAEEGMLGTSGKGWLVEGWSVCAICGPHVHTGDTHMHKVRKDTLTATECCDAVLATGSKGKHPFHMMHHDVHNLRKARMVSAGFAVAQTSTEPVAASVESFPAPGGVSSAAPAQQKKQQPVRECACFLTVSEPPVSAVEVPRAAEQTCSAVLLHAMKCRPSSRAWLSLRQSCRTQPAC